MINFKTKPHRAVSFVESAIMKAAESAGSLIAEIKYDGLRCNLIVTDEFDSAWLTRESTKIPALTYLNGTNKDRWDAFLKDQEQIFPNGAMIDGEAMVKGVNFQTSSGLLRTMWTKKTNIEYNTDEQYCASLNQVGKILPKAPFHLDPKHLQVVVYDVLPLDAAESGSDYAVPTVVRVEHAKVMVKLLNKHFPEIDWQSPASFDVFSIESLHELYEDVRKMGHEGLIVKDPFAPYRRGKKTGMWKMKPEDTVDGTVVGINWGTPGLANEGKVIGFQVLLETGVVVDANGISQAQMEEYTAAVNSYPEHEEFFNGWQAQVKFMEWTPDGSLRHPSFDGWRGAEGDEKVKV